MKIYTKTGDKGETSLYDGIRVRKDDIRVESYGTVDEINSALGLARNFVSNKKIVDIIYEIQRKLFDVAGELATIDEDKFKGKITAEDVEYLEKIIDEYIARIDNVNAFIIPGTNKASASLHLARTICRRAETRILTLSREEYVSPILIKYVNRLSDTIYAIARYLETNLKYVEFKK